MTLEAVPDTGYYDSTPAERERPSHIPAFEGKEVAFTKAKLTSAANLEIDDQVFRVDDYVRMVIEGRVSAVNHNVNDKTGNLERVHTIKAIDCQVVSWEQDAS